MFSLSKFRSSTWFWRLFASYFGLILIPALTATIFTYFYLVQLIEQDAEKANTKVLHHVSRTTDDFVSGLRSNMIMFVSSASVSKFTNTTNYGQLEEKLDVLDMMAELNRQVQAMSNLLNHQVDNLYVYSRRSGMVADLNGFHREDVYFTQRNKLVDVSEEQRRQLFSSRQMMTVRNFTIEKRETLTSAVGESGTYTSFIVSYPFTSNSPDVYLVVNLKQSFLQKQIAFEGGDGLHMFIISNEDQIVARSDADNISIPMVVESVGTAASGSDTVILGGRPHKSVYVQSAASGWKYVSLIDKDVLYKPANRIRMFALAFMLLFLAMGIVLSYWLSRRIYVPIREIKSEFESLHVNNRHTELQTPDELAVLRQWSKSFVRERKDLQQRFNEMKPVIHENFLSKVLAGEFKDELSIAYYCKEIDLSFDMSAPKQVVCVELQYFAGQRDALSETDRSFLLIDLKNRMQRMMPGKLWVTSMKPTLLACILEPALADQERDAGTVSLDAEQLKELLDVFAPYGKATIGVGFVAYKAEQLHESYRRALQLLEWKSMDPEVEVILDSAESTSEDRLAAEHFLSSDDLHRLTNVLKLKDGEALIQCVSDILELNTGRRTEANRILRLSEDMIHTIARFGIKGQEQEFNLERYSSWLDKLRSSITLEEVRGLFHEIGESIKNNEPTTELKSKQFADVLAYIHEHYAEELSLEQFATKLNMSLGHFSRSFKESVGEKYVDYVARYRMMVAKQLLCETELTIDEIAERVGYLGRNSFIKIFRKLEGITPGQYRILQQQEANQ